MRRRPCQGAVGHSQRRVFGFIDNLQVALHDVPAVGVKALVHQLHNPRCIDAMQVIRWRKNNGKKNEIGDTGRQQIQQDFLKAVAKQCLQIGNWTKISDFAKTLSMMSRL